MTAASAEVRVSALRVEVAAHGHDIVDEVSFTITPGEVLGLVGESGSGKTTIGLALLGHCRRGARIAGGEVSVGPQAIIGTPPAELRALRGSLVAYIPQDPGTALNPAMRLGEQLDEMLSVHLPQLNAAAREDRMGELLGDVALPDTPDFRRRYPHQVSGGQQQRLAIAMAFSCRPRLIVLDEPTTGLDVTTQAHVLRTVRELCARHGVAALYVSHDLAVGRRTRPARRRDVCRPSGRGRHRGGSFRGAAPSLYAPPAAGDAGSGGAPSARRHSRPCPRTGPPARGLLLQAAL